MRVMIKEKSFGEKQVLRNLDIAVEKGERAAIIGPSGRGKTTLLRIIAGLDRDFSGRIEEPFRQPAVLFQEDRLTESITALSNLRAVSSDRTRILSALRSVGLSGEERTIVSALSGGMKRRLAIARLLLADGDAFLLDEPFRALDEESRRECAAAILSHAGDRTLIFISHDREDARLLGAGKIISL